MIKRLFDIVFSLIFLILLLPLFIFLSIWIRIDSKGPVCYTQHRVGKNGKIFTLFKFRSMYPNSDKVGLITVGANDQRITGAGRYLRKYKLDELPQLINILTGKMSFVGPRPEVERYVALYNDEQKEVLRVRPGLTDYASLEFIRENEMLAGRSDPEKLYIREIMPAKLALNLKYIRRQSLRTDLKILFGTIMKIMK